MNLLEPLLKMESNLSLSFSPTQAWSVEKERAEKKLQVVILYCERQQLQSIMAIILQMMEYTRCVSDDLHSSDFVLM